MDAERGKYDKVMELLKRSKPVINDQEALTGRILHELRREKYHPGLFDMISDHLFGWAYIGWVRRSLVTVSFAILLVFIYQQSVILKRINAIDSQAVFTTNQLLPESGDRLDSKLLYRRANFIFPVKQRELTDKQVDDLIKTFKGLQIKYSDILKMIEEDPDLKNYIENKLNKKDREKLKL
jgi:hypothetical protein